MKNMTMSFLQQLHAIEEYHFNIVIGSAYPYFDTIQEFDAKQNINIYRSLSANEMSHILLDSDLAIVPASGVLFECIALGVPFITGYYIENQREIASYFYSQDHRISLGEFSKATITKNTLSIAFEYPHQVIESIDGKSKDRLLDEFERLLTI